MVEVLGMLQGAGALKRPPLLDLSVPCPTLAIVCPARGSNDDRYAVRL
jgi:hypothetical protein